MNPNINKDNEATRFGTGLEPVSNGKKAGIASGEARRKKRNRREWSQLIGSLPADVLKDDKQISPLVRLMEAAGIGTEEQCWDAVEVARMHRNAMEGDVSAFRALGDLDGDFKQNIGLDLDVVTPEQAAAEIMERIKRK